MEVEKRTAKKLWIKCTDMVNSGVRRTVFVAIPLIVLIASVLLSSCASSYYGDWNVAWSPDGTRIAFDSTRSHQYRIYALDANGTNIDELADGKQPAWSPDGSRIAFVFGGSIYLMNSDGNEQINLVGGSTNGFTGDPNWSPDGTMIAFASDRTGDSEIYVIDVESGDQVNLTQHPARDTEPAWSPDGDKIAFVSDRNGDQEIWVMNADGSHPTDLIDAPATETSPVSYISANRTVKAVERYPVWSPDGTKVLFLRPRYSWLHSDIYTANVDGTSPSALTSPENSHDSPVTMKPAWSPDGEKIAFTGYRDGWTEMHVEIYIMDKDGSNQTRLTLKPGIDSLLSLLPLPIVLLLGFLFVCLSIIVIVFFVRILIRLLRRSTAS
jgi:Tol biopolymer transport system component